MEAYSKSRDLTIQGSMYMDIGMNVIRSDYDVMDEIGAITSDLVEISVDTRKGYAVLLPLLPSDEGKDIVRLDPFLRMNYGLNLDEKVKVSKVENPRSVKLPYVNVYTGVRDGEIRIEDIREKLDKSERTFIEELYKNFVK